MISHVLDERGRNTLLACNSSGEMYSVLTGRIQAEPGKGKGSLGRFFGKKSGRKRRLKYYLQKDLLLPELKGKTKQEVIDELLFAIRDNGRIRNVDVVRESVMTREKEMSTAVGHGVAIPHARTDEVDGLVCAVGVHPDGIEFNGSSSSRVKIVVLTLSPARTSAPHVQLMAMITGALDEKGRAGVLSSRNREDMWRALTSERHAVPHGFGKPGR